MFTYIRSEPDLWTVGSTGPAGKWEPESDYGSADEAAQRCAWLNGGPQPGSPSEPATPNGFDEWCIVELLGHRRLAGRLTEVQIAGAGFLRLDIPAHGGDPARTQLIQPGSVYALHPVDEATARRAASSWRPAPVQRWELPAAPVAAQPGHDDDEDLDGDDLDGEGPF